MHVHTSGSVGPVAGIHALIYTGSSSNAGWSMRQVALMPSAVVRGRLCDGEGVGGQVHVGGSHSTEAL